MLDVAQQRIRDRRIEWRQADASSLPFDAGRFDAVISQFGVQSFPDKVVAAAEVRRVLRPGGVFLFSTWAGPQSNPLARIAQQTAEACFPGDTPTFYEVPWSYGDTRQIESDLRAGGFRHVSIQPVSLVGRAPSADYAAMGIVQGTPMANAISRAAFDHGRRVHGNHLRVAHARAGRRSAGAADAGLDRPSELGTGALGLASFCVLRSDVRRLGVRRSRSMVLRARSLARTSVEREPANVERERRTQNADTIYLKRSSKA